MTGDAMRGDIAERLGDVGVPPAMVRTAVRLIPDDVSGVLVYGSRARSDHLAESDLDLLGLVEQPRRTVHDGEVGLSFYTVEQLKTGIGSLFGAHLARDAHILWDPRGLLAACIAAIMTSLSTVPVSSGRRGISFEAASTPSRLQKVIRASRFERSLPFIMMRGWSSYSPHVPEARRRTTTCRSVAFALSGLLVRFPLIGTGHSRRWW